MSSFVLKIIAIICMFCDHFGDFYYGSTTILNYIGRFAFTIFAFQITQGYLHTHDIKKYILRLTIFAFISQIPYMIFYYSVFKSLAVVNVMATLLFGLITIIVYDKYNKYLGILTCIVLGITAQLLNFDYGLYGVFIVFMFFLLRNKKIYMSLVFILAVILNYYYKFLKYNVPFILILKYNTILYLLISSCLSIIPVFFFNGKKGKSAKYLFYIFYPVHLLILGLLKIFIFT